MDFPVTGTRLALLPDDVLALIQAKVQRDRVRNKYPKKLIDVEMIAVGREYHADSAPPLGFLAQGRDVYFQLTFASGDTEIVTQRYKVGPEAPVSLDFEDYCDMWEGMYIGLPFTHSDYLVSTIRNDDKVIWVDADDTLYYDCADDETYYDEADGDGYHELCH
jgi:hypothetical protein